MDQKPEGAVVREDVAVVCRLLALEYWDLADDVVIEGQLMSIEEAARYLTPRLFAKIADSVLENHPG